MSKLSVDASDESRFERWLAALLRGGTFFALVLIFAGLAINSFTGQSWIGRTDLAILLEGGDGLRSDPPANLAEFVYGFRSLQSLNFVQGAILVLILLPAFRVAFLLGNFVRRRETAFAAFSIFVLAALLVGFFFRLEL